ncbi:uncharacterized protein TRUGW13939_06953 [Talaromyces rugulosus]|uniref:Phosphoglycerate mutase family protein n=1 Tax=Talaromyces rugulosus TaxID=121627 RepID=A0A7H8R2G7_TALRU|nr:uncharacterized protein TRUGW13939_06953 [Talaromyces rugulosus]QKX59811.1 hypothetical protein TRUGW13939_06953 [Talaromyces rugulosus]
MKVFLIRHAETIHNVGQAWAGSTDSPLTSHGILQIERLAQYFASTRTRFSHVFSSDLHRAVATAEGINTTNTTELRLTALLQEQQFGSREGTVFRRSRRNNEEKEEDAVFVPAETELAMRDRANAFLNDYFLPAVFEADSTSQAIAIVAHGIILRVLWECLTRLFSPGAVQFSPTGGGGGALTPFWSNTGFMEVSIEPDAALLDNPTSSISLLSDFVLSGWSMTVLSIDSKPHLADLRRTRGGIGSMQHDTSQKRIDSFFRPRS